MQNFRIQLSKEVSISTSVKEVLTGKPHCARNSDIDTLGGEEMRFLCLHLNALTQSASAGEYRL